MREAPSGEPLDLLPCSLRLDHAALSLPFSHRLKRLTRQHLMVRHVPSLPHCTYLFVQGLIAKSNLFRSRRRAAEIDRTDARPVNGTQTHGTGLTGRIDDTLPEFSCGRFPTRSPYGNDFSMGRRVLVEHRAVKSASDDSSARYNHGPEWSSVWPARLTSCQLNRKAHEYGVLTSHISVSP